MKSESEFEAFYHRHKKMVWNLCYTFLQNPADTEDAVQEVFLRAALSEKEFHDHEHEKAWLIVTAKNACKDELKRARRKDISLEENETQSASFSIPPPQIDETLEVVRLLPENYRIVLYLFYYEGCTTAQIARLLNRPDSSIRSDLRRGRLMMRKRLEGLK